MPNFYERVKIRWSLLIYIVAELAAEGISRLAAYVERIHLRRRNKYVNMLLDTQGELNVTRVEKNIFYVENIGENNDQKG